MTPQSIRPQIIPVISSILIASGIILGAFGAHGLQGVLSESLISSFKTGVDYQIWEALALLVLYVLNVGRVKLGRLAMHLITIGTILFSTSIYLLCFKGFDGMHWTKYLWWITPAGGVLQILGWTLIVGYFYRCYKQKEIDEIED